MFVTIGTFETAQASKYLQQLCKHFAHKTEVSFTPDAGEVRFDMGVAHLQADPTGLTVRFELEDEGFQERAHMVIDKHLERFAFRENFTQMTWDA